MKKTKDIIHKALKKGKSLGASSIKIKYNQGERMSVDFEAGRLKETSGSENASYSVTVLVDGKLSTVNANRLDMIEKMVEQAVDLARYGKKAHFSHWPSENERAEIQSFSTSTKNLTRERMIEECRAIVERIKAYDPELFIGASGSITQGGGLLMTSDGLEYDSEGSYWSLSGSAQRSQDQDILLCWEGRGWREVNDYFEPLVIADKIIQQMKDAEHIVSPPTKNRVRMILDPQILSSLLYPVYLGVNGKNVFKGDSPLKEKLNQQVLDPAITIVDNPHIDFCGSSAELDDDGVPTRKQTLVERGVLKTFLYDLDTAGMAEKEPTGNNGCMPYNTIVTKGEMSLERMLKGLDDGVYVNKLLGFGQGNIINGDFSCNMALGYRVQNGVITGRIKDVMLSGNIYEILKNNVILSSDTNYTGFVPYALVEGISLK